MTPYNNHTLLYGLKPYGIGTAECESLLSYTKRLADAHRVGVGLFVKEIGKILYGKNIKNWDLRRPSFFLSLGSTTQQFTSALSHATGITELDNCTMLPLQDLTTSRDLIFHSQRFCPICIKEKMYGHLIWNIDLVNTCPKHEIKLTKHYCGLQWNQIPSPTNRPSIVGVCTDCGSIEYSCMEEEIIPSSKKEIWQAKQIGELISCFPQRRKLFDREKMLRGIIKASKKYIKKKNPTMPKSVISGWLGQIHRPTLENLLKLSFLAGVSLVSLIKGDPIKCWTPPIEENFVPHPDYPYSTQTKHKFLKTLQRGLTANPPVSVGHIACKLDVDKKTLYSLDLELCNQIKRRYKKYKKLEAVKREKEARKEAEKLTKLLMEQELPLTIRNFEKIAQQPLMPQTLLRKVLDMQLHQMNR